MKKFFCFAALFFISISLYAQFPEDFESGTFPPQDWLITDNGIDVDNIWQENTYNFNSPSTSAFLTWAPFGAIAEDWLVTPQFTPQPDESTLSYYEFHSFTTFFSDYSIRVSTESQDDLNDFEIVEAYSTSEFGPTNLWLQHFVDLSDYEGIPIYVAFVMANEDGDNWYIDDVELGAEPGCLDPILLGIDNLTAVGGDISFLETGIASLWEFEIIEGGSMPTGIPNAFSDGNNPYTWEGGITDTNYDIYMRSDCGADGFSEWVGPLNFTTLPPPPPNDDCATAIPLNVGGPSSCNPTEGYNSGATDSGYQHPCAFYQGGDVWYSFVAPADSAVWVETSQAPDGFFDGGLAVYEGTDCDSLTLLGCDDDGGNGLFSLIKLNNLTPGETYYIAVWEFGNDQFGDFNVCVYEPPTCLLVDFFFAFTDSVASDFAAVTWQTINPGAEFIVEYGPAGFIQGTGSIVTGTIGVDGPPVGLPGLDPSSPYDYYVQEVCAPGDSSIVQGPFFFFTLESCPAAFPWLFDQIFASLDSVAITWQSFNDSSTFIFEYGPPGFFPGTGTTVTGIVGVDAPPLGIGGLTEDTMYDYYLTEICAPGDTAFPVFGFMETLAPPPVNNDLCDAIELIINDPEVYYTNAGASLTGGAPLGTCWGGEYDIENIETVWFYFTANLSGEATVTTDFPDTELHDTHIAVYELPGGDCNQAFSVVEIGCDEDGGFALPNGFTSIVNLTGLTPGMNYYIQVDGFGTLDGEFGIQVLAEPDPSSVLELSGFGEAINMYPNPSNNHVSFSSSQNFGMVSLEFFDVVGQKVLGNNFILSSSNNEIIDVSTLTSGNYLVRIITENKTFISRLVIE